MSIDTQSDDGREYSAIELSEMDAREAHQKLTDEQFERWASYAELKDKEHRREQARQEAAADVIDVAVSAHLDELHEELDAYGDTVRYHFDITEEVAAVERTISDELGEADNRDEAAEQLADLNAERIELIKDALTELFAVLWVEFENDETGESVRYDEYDDDAVRRHIRGVVDAWGVRPAYLKMHEMMDRIREHDAEVVEKTEKFPAQAGGGAGAPNAAQWARDNRRAPKRNDTE